jgi:hypothetical protein
LLNLPAPLASAAEEESTAMAIDVAALQASQQQHAQAIAQLQRAVDQLAQQQALHTQALLHAIRGRWDAPKPYSWP